jgi:hypothetical protein
MTAWSARQRDHPRMGCPGMRQVAPTFLFFASLMQFTILITTQRYGLRDGTKQPCANASG